MDDDLSEDCAFFIYSCGTARASRKEQRSRRATMQLKLFKSSAINSITSEWHKRK